MPEYDGFCRRFCFFLLLLALLSPCAAAAQVTVFVPSVADISDRNKPLEADILMTMMRPFQNRSLPMDMPQMFAELRYEKEGEAPARRDLLGDVEEIVYLGQKAWGANVALQKPGLYQFIMETRPWAAPDGEYFIQQLCKVMLPVLGVDYGWNLPAGMGFEIMPLTRPFGICAPALFTGRAQLLGKPLADIPVRMGRINIEKKGALTPWHEELAGVTNQAGEFAFILNQSGWWYCEAQIPGDPVKGADGEMKPVKFGSVLWLYVDAPVGRRKN